MKFSTALQLWSKLHFTVEWALFNNHELNLDSMEKLVAVAEETEGDYGYAVRKAFKDSENAKDKEQGHQFAMRALKKDLVKAKGDPTYRIWAKQYDEKDLDALNDSSHEANYLRAAIIYDRSPSRKDEVDMLQKEARDRGYGLAIFDLAVDNEDVDAVLHGFKRGFTLKEFYPLQNHFTQKLMSKMGDAYLSGEMSSDMIEGFTDYKDRAKRISPSVRGLNMLAGLKKATRTSWREFKTRNSVDSSCLSEEKKAEWRNIKSKAKRTFLESKLSDPNLTPQEKAFVHGKLIKLADERQVKNHFHKAEKGCYRRAKHAYVERKIDSAQGEDLHFLKANALLNGDQERYRQALNNASQMGRMLHYADEAGRSKKTLGVGLAVLAASVLAKFAFLKRMVARAEAAEKKARKEVERLAGISVTYRSLRKLANNKNNSPELQKALVAHKKATNKLWWRNLFNSLSTAGMAAGGAVAAGSGAWQFHTRHDLV